MTRRTAPNWRSDYATQLGRLCVAARLAATEEVAESIRELTRRPLPSCRSHWAAMKRQWAKAESELRAAGLWPQCEWGEL